MKTETTEHFAGGNLVQALAGPWALAEEYAMMLGQWMRSAQGTISRGEGFQGYIKDRNVAIIEVHGTMYKQSIRLFGMEFLGTLDLAAAVRSADAAPDIQAIVLHMDTPGGMVAGTNELATAVREAQKPVVAVVSDLCASAGYWVASQAQAIVANETAVVGSIGTYALLYDWSGWFNEAGVKAHVVRAGEFKGMASMGTEITEAQLAEFQRTVNDINGVFVSAVTRARGDRIGDVAGVATGQVWIARESISKGLIDRIGTLDEVVDGLSRGQLPGGKGPKGLQGLPLRGSTEYTEHTEEENEIEMGAEGALAGVDAPLKTEVETMTPEKDEKDPKASAPVAASLAELKSAFPDAGAEWREGQLEASATLEQATQSYVKLVQARAAEATTRAEAAEKKLAEGAATDAAVEKAVTASTSVSEGGAGVKGIGDQGLSAKSGTGGGAEGFLARVDALKAEGKETHEAMRMAAVEDPEGREAWVAAYNRQHAGKAAG